MSTNEQKAQKSPTPLWIIASFISLSEISLTVGVIQTEGGIQVALTVFVLLFPLIVASLFFLILWNRPYVLYPPSDYGRETDVGSYVDAMLKKQSGEQNLFQNIEEVVLSSLTSDEAIKEITQKLSPIISENIEKEVAQIMDSTADEVVEKIRKTNFFTIDFRPILGDQDGKVEQVVYRPQSPMTEIFFLVSLKLLTYFEKNPSVSQVEWHIVDIDNERIIDTYCSYRSGEGYLEPDERTLSSVGIKPGMNLKVILDSN